MQNIPQRVEYKAEQGVENEERGKSQVEQGPITTTNVHTYLPTYILPYIKCLNIHAMHAYTLKLVRAS